MKKWLNFMRRRNKKILLYNKDKLDKMNIEVITDDFTYITKNNLLRHDNIKVGFHIFYYLMKK